MIEVTFNGVNLSQFADIVDVRRDVLAPRTLQTIEVPKRDGAYLYGKKSMPRLFEVDLRIVNEVETKRADLASLLDTEEAKPLEFSFNPGVEYYAVVTGETQLTQEMQFMGTFTIQFQILDIYGYGTTHTMSIPSSSPGGIGTVSVFGDVKVYPELKLTFEQDASFVVVTNGDKYMQLGIPETAEKAPAPREELSFADNASSLTGWTALSGTLEDNTLNGAISTNGYSFNLSNKGTGTNTWHGAAIAKSLPVSLQDFVFQAKVQMKTSTNSQMGKIDIYFRNAAGEQVGKMTMKDDTPKAKGNRSQSAIGLFGQRDIIIDTTRSSMLDFDGLFRFRREGTMMRANYTQLVDGKSVASFSNTIHDTKGLFSGAVTSVVIAMTAYDTYAAPVGMFVEDIKFWKVNTINNTTQVDEAFHIGDELSIDMNRGVVELNGVNAVKYVQPGSQFFSLDSPQDSVSITPEGVASTSVIYRSRWY